MSETVYKVLTGEEFAALRDGGFSGSAADLADGFIHLSTAAQLGGTVERHFSGQEGLMLLAIPTALLGAALRWEASRGGALFPHLYGVLRWQDVRAHAPLRYDGGAVALP